MNIRRTLKILLCLVLSAILLALIVWLFTEAWHAIGIESQRCYAYYGSSQDCPSGVFKWFYTSVLGRIGLGLLFFAPLFFLFRRFLQLLAQRRTKIVESKKIPQSVKFVNHLKEYSSIFIQKNQLLLTMASLIFGLLALFLPFSSYYWESASAKTALGWEWLVLAPITIMALFTTPDKTGIPLAASLFLLLISNLSYLILIHNFCRPHRTYRDYFFFGALIASAIVSPLPGYYFWIVSLFLNFLISYSISDD